MAVNLNITSKNIAVFPAVNRDIEQSNDIYSRHTSEQFLTGIVNKLIDRDGFVITEKEDFNSGLRFAFNIHGYYFEIDDLDKIIKTQDAVELPAGAFLYAYIRLEKHGVWTELVGNDATQESGNDGDPTTYKYTSLTITSVKPVIPETEKDTTFFLTILGKTPAGESVNKDWNGTGWYVPEDSYIKFDGPSFILDTIDGGDLDKLIIV